MSVNFGYSGYGMMNGIGANQMQNQGGGIYQNSTNQYNCPMCYQYGAVPYNHRTYINPIPKSASNPSFFDRIMKKILGA